MNSYNYSEHIAKKITKLRLEKNISSRKLSFCLNLSHSHISNIENGNYSISIDTLVKLCDFFGITLSEFFYVPELDHTNLNLQQQHVLNIIKNLNHSEISLLINTIEKLKFNND